MKYQPIMAASGYVLSPDRKKVLLLHRSRRENDDSHGKWMGIGGKMESTEDIVSCLKREVLEEAGIECLSIRLRGTINWTGFGPRAEDWFGFIFIIDSFKGEPLSSNPEGTLHWIPMEEIFQLPIWEGDYYFLPLLFDNDPRVFHGHMAYNQGKVSSWSFQRV